MPSILSLPVFIFQPLQKTSSSDTLAPLFSAMAGIFRLRDIADKPDASKYDRQMEALVWAS